MDTRSGDAMPTVSVDGGWKDEREQALAMKYCFTSESVLILTRSLAEPIKLGRMRTVLRQDVVPDPQWDTVGAELRALGWSELMFSVFPLPAEAYSCLGLHRRVGKPPFGERERCLVHVVFQSVEWLHGEGLALDAGRTGLQLTPRQRQVLLLLLKGDSQKMIASKMGISRHTVVDYMKQIHRKFGVSSRGELLARFISGTASSNAP